MNGTQREVLVTAGTIGNALAEALAAEPQIGHVWLAWRSTEPVIQSDKITALQFDVSDEHQVRDNLKGFAKLDGIVNTVGLLHRDDIRPEKSINGLQPENFEQIMRANVLPTLMLAKHGKRLLKNSENSFFAALSARVGSIQDNHLGGWYSYRMSKAALNMALKTLAIEWRIALPRCTVAALHPGTVESPLSQPFTTRIAPEKLLSPEECARHLKHILLALDPRQSGRFWSWDASEIPW